MTAPDKPALTHFDETGQAHMVDVGAKASTKRMAIATGTISMTADSLHMIERGSARKGDVLGVARVAAIQGAKRTPDLIPLCHPIGLTRVAVEFVVEAAQLRLRCTVTTECYGPTGVEMEALTAVQIGLLTVYDMMKAVDRGMTIDGVMLLQKEGGKSGSFSQPAAD